MTHIIFIFDNGRADDIVKAFKPKVLHNKLSVNSNFQNWNNFSNSNLSLIRAFITL